MEYVRIKKLLTGHRFFYVSVALLLVIVFHNIFESVISTTIVRPVLSKIAPTIVNDLALLLISLLFVFYTSQKFAIGYFVNIKLLAGLALICIAYSWYRFTEDVWHFVSTSIVISIRYLDILYLPFAMYALLFLIQKWKSKAHPYQSKFIEDNPLYDSKGDILNYNNYCSRISEKIDTSVFSRSFSIGINGEWGSGKTSFMHLIENHLTKHDQTIIHFNPWSSRSANGIVIDFFNALAKELRVYHADVYSKIHAYANTLVENSNNPLVSSVTALKNGGGLSVQYEAINDTLKEIGRQTIVFIDDLDRLDEFEAHEVIKLVRNTANFFNMVFIVAYDRNYLIQSIRKINDHNAEFFLEKIFQLEINLPHIEHRVIRRKLIETLVDNLGHDLRSEIEEVVNDTYYYKNHFLNDFIVTIRDANRIANSLILNHPLVEGEVIFSEFFLVEQLKVKFPAVYELLYRHEAEFLESKQEGPKKFAYKLKAGEHGQKILIEQYLESNADRLSINKRFIPKVMLLLKSLFPINQVFNPRRTDHLSIRYPSNFYKYFGYRVLDTNLSEVEFTKARKLPQKQLEIFITEKVNAGQGWNLRDRFEDIKAFDDKEDFEKVIRAIFHLAKQSRGATPGQREFMEYSGEDLYDKLYNKDNVLAKRFYDGNEATLKQFVLPLFQDATYPYFVEGSIIKDLTNRTFLEGFVLKLEDLEEISLAYLEKFLKRQHNFSYEVWWHYNNCHFKKWHFHGGSYTSEVYIIEKAKTLVIEFIKKDVKGFFDTIIEYDAHNKEYSSIYQGVKDLFGDWETFYAFLEGLGQEGVIIEFKNFYLAFREKNFAERIKFEFNHLKNSIPKA